MNNTLRHKDLKRSLREEATKMRDALLPEERKRHGEAIMERLFELEEFKQAD